VVETEANSEFISVGGSENIVVDQQVGENSTSSEADDISSNSGALPDML
jgi:hypothetical protein